MAQFVNEHAVDFLRRTAAAEDGVLAAIRGACVKEKLPLITPEAGSLIHVLLKAMDARRVLEIGTCLGYSGVWIARALPDGGLLETIELDKQRAAAANEWFRKADLDGRIKVLEGKALGVLPTLPTKSYDAVFIDADKEHMPEYLDQAVKLLRHGGLLLADNIFWHGSTFSELGNIEGSAEVKLFVNNAMEHAELTVSIVPVGDGLMVAHRR